MEVTFTTDAVENEIKRINTTICMELIQNADLFFADDRCFDLTAKHIIADSYELSCNSTGEVLNLIVCTSGAARLIDRKARCMDPCSDYVLGEINSDFQKLGNSNYYFKYEGNK